MTATATPPRPSRHITLQAAGLPLSALLSEPGHTPPRATVIALHGAGMTAGYFDTQTNPGLSLLALGAHLGFTVLAVDRPGYRRSAALLPEGQTLADQAHTLRAALKAYAAIHDIGAGFFLLAHSYGGKLALTTAAHTDTEPGLLGLDISGCGHRYRIAAGDVAAGLRRVGAKHNWGALHLYPPNTFHAASALVHPVPERELRDAEHWPETFDGLAARVRVPIRLTFAEHEHWWEHDGPALTDLRSRLTGAPRVTIDRQRDAGHNISLGWSARPYHLRAFGFMEECLLDRARA